MEERKVPSRKHAVPPIMIHSGTPCPPDTTAQQLGGFALPQINQHRNVVANGHFPVPHQHQQQHPDDVYALRQDQVFYNSYCSLRDASGGGAPLHMRQKQLHGTGSNVQLLQLPGGGGGGGSSVGYSPQSPSLSDVSSVRLTPRSPLSRLSLIDAPCKSAPGNKTPQHRLSLPPLYNLGYNVGSNVDLDETNPSPLIPPLHSLSPYLDVPSLPSIISPLHSAHHLSRKRALSSSPLSDLLDFNSLIRSSPNSLVAIINNSPYPYQTTTSPNPPLGSIGHLTVQQTLPLSATPSNYAGQVPGGGQYTVQRRKTSVEHEHHSNGTITTITNQITIHKPPTQSASVDDDNPNLAVQHAADVMEMDYDCLSCKSTNSASVPQPQALEELSDPLICMWNNCGRTFEEQDDLVQHIETHHIEKGKVDVFTCQWQSCPRNRKPFNARYKLLIHMRIHSGEKPNKCTYAGCTKAFSRLENLKIHLRTHTGEKPYLCQYNGCNKSFSNSSDRSKHQKTHYDQKPYTCNFPGCNKRYTDPSSLRKHCKIHLQHQRKKPRNDSEDGGTEDNLDCCLTIQPLAYSNGSSPKPVPKLEGGGGGGGDSKPSKITKVKNLKKPSKSPNPTVTGAQDERQDFAPPNAPSNVNYFHQMPTSYPPSSHSLLQAPRSPHSMHIHSPMIPSPEHHHHMLHLPSPTHHQHLHTHSPSSYQAVAPGRAISMHSPGGGVPSPSSPMQVVLSPMQPMQCANLYNVAAMTQQQQQVPYPIQYNGYSSGPGMQQYVPQGMMQCHASMGMQQPMNCFYQDGHPLLNT